MSNGKSRRIPRKLKKKIKKRLPNFYSIDFIRNKKETSNEYTCIKSCKFNFLGFDQIRICKLTNEEIFENCKSCKKEYHK
jgi:hypothetical protein